MKILLMDEAGMYDKNGRFISQTEGSKKMNYGEMIIKYGFDLYDITDVSVLKDKKIMSLKNKGDANTGIKFKNRGGGFVLVKYNLDHHEAITSEHKFITSNDGVNWNYYTTPSSFESVKLDIPLDTFDKDSITEEQKRLLGSLRSFFDKKVKKLSHINNSKNIKFILFMIEEGKEIEEVSSLAFVIRNAEMRDENLKVEYGVNSINVTNTYNGNINKMTVKIISTDNYKVTLEEF